MNFSELKNLPLVSIGVPVYNGAHSIGRVLQYLSLQTYENLEIIVSDNCSTDGTVAIVKEFMRKDSRVKLFINSYNRGSLINFNDVLDKSNGKYFMWVAHDDSHELSFVEKCVDTLERDDEAVLCAPSMQMVSLTNGTKIWSCNLNSFLHKRHIWQRFRETINHFPAVAIYGLYRTESAKSTNLLPKLMGGDLLFIQQLSLKGPFIGLSENLFTRIGRDRWNTKEEDARTFFGSHHKPSWLTPFIPFTLYQFKILYRCKEPLWIIFILFVQLISHILRQIFLKIIIRLLGVVLPSILKRSAASFIYWKFMNGPNIKPENDSAFYERIIKPRIGWSGL